MTPPLGVYQRWVRCLFNPGLHKYTDACEAATGCDARDLTGIQIPLSSVLDQCWMTDRPRTVRA